MTDAKEIGLEPEQAQVPVRLACPLTLNVVDYDGRLWLHLKQVLTSHLIRLHRLEEPGSLPKGARQVLLLVDHPMSDLLYEKLEQDKQQELDVVIVGDTTNTALMRRAMRMGASDFLPLEPSPEELWAAMIRIADKQAVSTGLAPLTLILNGKPGSGASFISANLGQGMAEKYADEQILLVDSNQNYASLSDYFNIREASGSLLNALQHESGMDGMALTGMVSSARARIDLLPSGTLSLRTPVSLSSKSCAQLVYLMRCQYQQVVIDMSRGLESWSLPMLEAADHILLVTQQSLSALRETRNTIKRLRSECGISKERIILLVNRYEKRKTLTVKEIEKATEVSRILTLPNDFKLVEDCTDMGKLVVEVDRRHKMVRAFADIVREIGPPDEANQRPGLLRRLFSRR